MKILILGNLASHVDVVSHLGEVTSNISAYENNPDDFCLVLFTGGEDVTPSFYGDTSPLKLCYNNTRRDIIEKRIFEICLQNKTALTGICRGSQFLNVMSGGKLIHDLNGHTSVEHLMVTAKDTITINSYHHQMSILNNNSFLLGYSPKRASHYYGNGDELFDYKGPEVESFWCPDTKVAAVQYHPEWLDPEDTAALWYKQLLEDFLTKDYTSFYKEYVIEQCAKLSINI